MRTSDADFAPAAPRTGLVLTGGGARGAYQVGALRAVMDLYTATPGAANRNPFPIICGTSAGAINAAALACRAHDPAEAVLRLHDLWQSLRVQSIYRSDAAGLLGTGARWLGLMTLGWMWPALRANSPRSLLDNQPLSELLRHHLDFSRFRANLQDGVVTALAITASGYGSGEHLTFYESLCGIQPWRRSLRRAVATQIGIEHLLASSAIPFVFPARMLDVHGSREWCGDGSMRQLAPISPAIHLGADKVLVIGTGYRDETRPEMRQAEIRYPSPAQIGGHAMANIFLDGLSSDIERLERTNASLREAPELAEKLALRPLRVLALMPSRSLDDLALAHFHRLPRTLRAFFNVLGVAATPRRQSGGVLLSYLLFDAGYTQALMELGYADTMRRSETVTAFFRETQA